MTVNAPEPDEDLGTDPTVGDDQPDDADDAAEEYTAPTQAEWAAVQERLKKANKEATKYRLRSQGRYREDDEDEDDDRPDPAKARAEEKKILKRAAAEAESTWKPRLVKAHALAALSTAGAKNPERLARLVDQSQITFDEDGEPEGLDDQVEALKGDYPELFEQQRGSGSRRPTRGIDGGRQGGGGKRALSATEQQLQRAGLLGQ